MNLTKQIMEAIENERKHEKITGVEVNALYRDCILHNPWSKGHFNATKQVMLAMNHKGLADVLKREAQYQLPELYNLLPDDVKSVVTDVVHSCNRDNGGISNGEA